MVVPRDTRHQLEHGGAQRIIDPGPDEELLTYVDVRCLSLRWYKFTDWYTAATNGLRPTPATQLASYTYQIILNPLLALWNAFGWYHYELGPRQPSRRRCEVHAFSSNVLVKASCFSATFPKCSADIPLSAKEFNALPVCFRRSSPKQHQDLRPGHALT